MYIGSKYDTTILVICLCIIVFVFTMISSEIEKRETKFKDGIISISLLLGILGFDRLASRFKSLEYLFYLLVLMSCIFILSRDIISFCIKKKYSKWKNISMRINYGGTITSICFIIINLELTINTAKLDFIIIFVIIILLIDLPMDYSVNHHLNLYENGIFISTFSFPKKIIPYIEFIPYKNIESLTFLEYEKGKFILKIQAEKSVKKSPCIYKIKDKDREEIVSFLSNFIEKEKIAISKDYD